MPRRRRITDENLRQVAEARSQGVPWKVIVAELGFSRTRLWQLLNAHLAQTTTHSEGKHNEP